MSNDIFRTNDLKRGIDDYDYSNRTNGIGRAC
jgi:hypothetical protein